MHISDRLHGHASVAMQPAPEATPPANHTWRSYYYAGGVRVATPALAPDEALRSEATGGRSAGASVRTGGQTYYLLGDHPRSRRGQVLGGANVTANSSGAQISKLLYRPWGETRFTTGTTPTTWRFTGQREDATIGLYFYNARYLDPQLGRFISPDTIVPAPGNPQALNRYSYVLNNPVRYTDPSGHVQVCADGDAGGGCGSGANTSQIWQVFANKRSPLLDYYALLHRLTQAQASAASAVELEALAGAVESAYAAGSAWLPQHQFDPAMVVEPASLVSLGGALTSGGMRVLNGVVGGLKQGVGGGNQALVPYYPPNDGFAGKPVKDILKPGTFIDRYGSPSGRYASPQGTPAWARALPPGAEQRPLNAYEVVKPLQVDAGPTAAWFGQPGGGTQYYLGRSVEKLIELGYLRPLQ